MLEVLSYAQKKNKSYFPLPTHLEVSAPDPAKPHAWFTFSKSEYHPIGVVKATAKPGEVTKEDHKAVPRSLTVTLEVSLLGDHKGEYESFVIHTPSTHKDNTFWFQRIFAHVPGMLSLRFTCSDESIAPLEHVVAVGDGKLLTQADDHDDQSDEDKAYESPRKSSRLAGASTPVVKSNKKAPLNASSKKSNAESKTATAISVTNSTRKSSRRSMEDEEDADDLLDEAEEAVVVPKRSHKRKVAEPEFEEDLLIQSDRRSSRATASSKEAVIETPAAKKVKTETSTKKKKVSAVDLDDDEAEDDFADLYDREDTKKVGKNSKANPAVVKKEAGSSKAAAAKNNKTKTRVNFDEDVVSDNDHGENTDLEPSPISMTRRFFANLCAPPVTVTLPLKNRLERTPFASLTLRGPLMTLTLPASLVHALQYDQHTVAHHTNRLLAQHLEVLENGGLKGVIDDDDAQLNAEDAEKIRHALSPSAHVLFDRLLASCIGLNNAANIVKYLRVLFEEACQAQVLFYRDVLAAEDEDGTNLTESDLFARFHEVYNSSQGSKSSSSGDQHRALWASLLGPFHFLRFVVFLVGTANHPEGT